MTYNNILSQPNSLLVDRTTTAREPLNEILFITSYPPRECGIATYSQDLIKALNNKFNQSFKITICPIESESELHVYEDEIDYILNIDSTNAFHKLAKTINENPAIGMVLIQHEFGFFEKKGGNFKQFLNALDKPIIMVFHTVLPQPDAILKIKVQRIAEVAACVVVMTNTSAKILINDYAITSDKITVIPHGTHLVQHLDKDILKKKYHLEDKKILSTFGLLSSGKSIETTLNALPAIVENNKDVVFLIIGKTHPSVVKQQGEQYRTMLEAKVVNLQLQNHVRFINHFLPLPELLEYLQLTDIYLFTSKNPNQAVSGTFSYAVSCGCPIISTPIPHATEVLKNDGGIIIDFEDSVQLSTAAISLLQDEELRKNISSKGLHLMAATAWENAAIAHAILFKKVSKDGMLLHYNLPTINLDYVKKLTTKFGMIQFSIINQPDINSGYTLDDNARAMVAVCQHFELTKNEEDIVYITRYLNFIKFCFQSKGDFLNYVNEEKQFTEQNYETNLEDSNGRAIWALGYLVSLGHLLPQKLVEEANYVMEKALLNATTIHSTRAMAFIVKGLYYRNITIKSSSNKDLVKQFANRLVEMYRHEADENWQWFESYLTYGNSILPEAMLCAWLVTNEPLYKDIAKMSFDFLLSKIFRLDSIKVISNKGWLLKNNSNNTLPVGGEQPIDIAYTILALSKFYAVFNQQDYYNKLHIAFNWFLGDNHLNQIVYNPCTGGCYDGIEEENVNLNQGAESTVSYLMARLTLEKLRQAQKNPIPASVQLNVVSKHGKNAPIKKRELV